MLETPDTINGIPLTKLTDDLTADVNRGRKHSVTKDRRDQILTRFNDQVKDQINRIWIAHWERFRPIWDPSVQVEESIREALYLEYSDRVNPHHDIIIVNDNDEEIARIPAFCGKAPDLSTLPNQEMVQQILKQYHYTLEHLGKVPSDFPEQCAQQLNALYQVALFIQDNEAPVSDSSVTTTTEDTDRKEYTEDDYDWE